jgi:hypothetical protein
VIALTELGARLFRKASPSHLHTIYDAFVAALTDEQLRAVEDAMLSIRAHLAPAANDERAFAGADPHIA